MMDQICRAQSWTLGTDQGEMTVTVPQQDGSDQVVTINDFNDPSGQAAIRVWSPVTVVGKVPPDQALTVNFQLPAGALATNAATNQIVVCATRIVGFVNQAQMVTLISTVAHFASFYANHYGQ
jgi:hypothetical protein